MVRDYSKRPITVDKTTVNEKNTTLLAGMQDSLKTPDEVWLNGKELEQIIYVKYYKDRTIITVGTISKGKLRLSNWKTLKEVKAEINNYRRGLLVYSKK